MRRANWMGWVGMAALVAACAPSLIPGTQIRDTTDHRSILDLVAKYERAFEERNAAGIAALASSDYLDPLDSISRATLEADLSRDFDQLKDAQLDVQVRQVTVEGDKARVEYFYTANFLLKTPNAEWKRESDDKRMLLVREGGAWKVQNGF